MQAPWLSVTGTPFLVDGRNCTPEWAEEPRRHNRTDPIEIAHRTRDRTGPRQHLADQDGTTVDLGQLQPNAVCPAWGGDAMSGAAALWGHESMGGMSHDPMMGRGGNRHS